MGSGSSKGNKTNQQKKDTIKSKSPVANVNNNENKASANEASFYRHENSPIKAKSDSSHFNESQEYRNLSKKEKKAKNKQLKGAERNEIAYNNASTRLDFEEDSDFENDIDEVLKIPVAQNNRRDLENDRRRKKRWEDPDQNTNNHYSDNMFNNNNFNVTSYLSREELPETYAQRQQRQQYKLQQDFLLRQKTIHRDAKEWDDAYSDEEGSPTRVGGFDASKFRNANKKEGVLQDKPYTNQSQEYRDDYFTETTGQDLNDVDIIREPVSRKALPSYDQSELDLMRELENEIL